MSFTAVVAVNAALDVAILAALAYSCRAPFRLSSPVAAPVESTRTHVPEEVALAA